MYQEFAAAVPSIWLAPKGEGDSWFSLAVLLQQPLHPDTAFVDKVDLARRKERKDRNEKDDDDAEEDEVCCNNDSPIRPLK